MSHAQGARGTTTVSPPQLRYASPWGIVEVLTVLAPGIVAVSTPSHGGIWLSPDRYARIPQTLKDVAARYAVAPWFEEDCDAAIVGFVFAEELAANPDMRRFVDGSRALIHARPQYYGCFGWKENGR